MCGGRAPHKSFPYRLPIFLYLSKNLHLSIVVTASKLSDWSRGMIPALGAGGPGFDSRIGPNFLNPNHFSFDI